MHWYVASVMASYSHFCAISCGGGGACSGERTSTGVQQQQQQWPQTLALSRYCASVCIINHHIKTTRVTPAHDLTLCTCGHVHVCVCARVCRQCNRVQTASHQSTERCFSCVRLDLDRPHADTCSALFTSLFQLMHMTSHLASHIVTSVT